MLMKFLFVVFIFGAVIQSSSAEAKAREFRLVLLPPKYRANQLQQIDIAKLRPNRKPLLDENDVLRYDADYHRLVLDYFAASRLRELRIPRTGLPFAVFAGDDAIYVGAFFAGYSMENFKGVAVDVAPLKNYPPSLLFELDYPPLAPKNAAKDPRGDPRLLNSFEKAGKLYREVWLDSVCSDSRATGKRRLSYVFEFKVRGVSKGSFPDPTVSFEIFADERSSALFDLLKDRCRPVESPLVRLKFQGQVKDGSPVVWFQDYELLK